MKLLTSIFLGLFCISAKAQTSIKRSVVPDHMVLQSEKVVNDFFEAYNNKDDIARYLTPGEANFNGMLWLPVGEFIKFLGQFMKRPVQYSSFEFYTIDDIEKDEQLKEKVIDFGLVFNNYSVLGEGSVNGKKSSIILNVQGEDMKIYSVSFPDIPVMRVNKKEVSPSDTIPLLKIALKVPSGFSKPVKDKNTFTLKFEGERASDQIIQIFYNSKQAELGLITHRWAEHVTSRYRSSEFEIGYVPHGYVYKYEVLDENDQVNQGITMGMEHNGQIIFIQYFGFKDLYNRYWIEIDQMMRNIRKL